MVTDDKCMKMQESFPLLYTSVLTDRQKSDIIDHINTCDTCRSVFNTERAMFLLAAWQNSNNPLENHLDYETLELLSSPPQEISDADRERITEHITECSVCKEILNKVVSLPVELDELVSEQDIPFINELDNNRQAISEMSGIRELFKQVSRYGLPILAVAALVVLVSVQVFMKHDHLPTINAHFPVVTRGAPVAQVFQTSGEPCEFTGNLFIDPEKDHIYNITVKDPATGSTIKLFEHFTAFDNRGLAQFKLQLESGKYQLVVSDIEDNDTLQTVYPFEIQLQN